MKLVNFLERNKNKVNIILLLISIPIIVIFGFLLIKTINNVKNSKNIENKEIFTQNNTNRIYSSNMLSMKQWI